MASKQPPNDDDQPSWINEKTFPAAFGPKTTHPSPPTDRQNRRNGTRTLDDRLLDQVNSGRDTRSWNKLLRPVMESKGIVYGPDVEGEALAQMFKKALVITENQVSRIIKDLENARKVSLCFLVDATSSMTPHISGVHKFINMIVNELAGKKDCNDTPRGAYGGSSLLAQGAFCRPGGRPGGSVLEYLELAFVGYRDLGDEKVGVYEVFDFSTDVEAFRKFVSKVVAIGGGDVCEHALGGLQQCLSLKWNDICRTKLIFHIADAPCHGSQFHDFVPGSNSIYDGSTPQDTYDRFLGGVPGGPDVDDLFEELQNKSILYNFGEIHPGTKKMIKVFSESYGDVIKTYDIKDPINILDAVVESVTASVDATIASSKAGVTDALVRTYDIETIEPNWDGIEERTICSLVFNLPASAPDFQNGINVIIEGVRLTRNVKPVSRVKIAPKPFAAGVERFAFYGFVQKTKVAFKEFKAIGRGHDSAARYEQANEMQTVASFLALEFNRRLKQCRSPICFGLPNLKFLMVKTVSFTLPNGSIRHMSQENFIQNASNFVRFNNNVDYVVSRQKATDAGITYDFVDLVLAFCHWTHAVTNGFLMVVDLEGCLTNGADADAGAFEPGSTNSRLLLLTDPAIHCKDPLRYAPLNLGEKGFDLFFKDHKCNKFCRFLGISRN